MATEPRTDLLNALSDVFRRFGYEGATLSELARAANLRRASLYHHFPGGKAEIAIQVLTHCADELDQLAYQHLRNKAKWNERLGVFVEGFSQYVDDGTRNCALVALTGSGGDAIVGAEIRRRTRVWVAELASVFADSGMAAKRAERSASELLARLYGALALALLMDKPKLYRQATKRLRNQLKG
jgi:TetR/AcrR family transcriptional repressor of lmrAB and yxaGH operons